ncbi:MAG: rhomboid family intramembrane serine protease [Hyphomicrobiales bacterium]
MFLPLHDANPLTHVRHPYVNWALLVITILVFVLFQLPAGPMAMMGLPASFGVIPSVLFETRALPPDLTVIPADWTLVSYAFFHGGPMHLIGNMLFLWVFGDNIEDAMGHIKYFFFYLLCAAGAGFAHALFLPASEAPLIGASGAVAGVVAAYLILHPRVKIWVLALGRIPLRLSALWVLGAWIVMQVYNLFAAADSEVAWMAHIGGLICGAALVLLLKRAEVPLFDRGLDTP